MMGSAIVTALRESNRTLDKEERTLSPIMYDQIMYYLALNKAGRGKVIQAETAMVTDFVSILENLSKEHDGGHVYVATSALRYGIMREMPSLWSGKFHDEVGKETSLVHAVEGLSLGNVYVTTSGLLYAGHENISGALRYAIMRKTPSLWSGEYRDEAGA